MTQKELLYIEDAIKHEDNIISILEDSANKIKDEKIVEFIYGEESRHNSLREKLIKKLKECSK